MFTEFKIVSIVQTICFAVLGALTVFLFHRLNGKYKVPKINRIFISLIILSVIKTVAGILAAVDLSLKNLNVALSIVVMIMDSIALRFVMGSMLSWLSHLNYSDVTPSVVEQDDVSDKKEDDSPQSKYNIAPRLDRLCQVLLTVGVICIAAGSGITSSDPSTGISVNKAGSCIFAAALLVLVIIAAKKYQVYSSSATYQDDLFAVKEILIVIFLCFPFMVVRVAYSILSSFSQTSSPYTDPSKYAILFGTWYYFCFMSFVMETVVVSLLTCLSFIIWKKRRTMAY